jgi:hypothetical protein
MRKQAERRPLGPSLLLILIVGLLAFLSVSSFADEPKPDPSGIATGDHEGIADSVGGGGAVAGGDAGGIRLGLVGKA